MFPTRITVDRHFTIAELDRRVFGTFVEHLGRCVYTGIHEPGHPTADEHGFRQDVLDLVRELGPTIARYPGGNFMSGYNWEDGVGPVADRPRRLDLAWFSTETNEVGTNEFMAWCRKAGIEPMLGVNLGTRGPDEARHYLEYCNHPGGTTLSDLRRSHGQAEPHDVQFWCLGNEMDGPWQICQKTPDEYGRIAQETAKLMRMVDPRIQLAACGSSMHTMPTYGLWEDRVLEHCYEMVDFISLHIYFENPHADTKEFFANIELMDRFIGEIASVADSVGARKRSKKKLMLSFDEWNVWYRARHGEHLKPSGWPVAPPLLEEVYNMEDALVNGGALITMMNRADRVKVACQAQLVNVIGPIMTVPGGPAWRQTIFHPFAQAARHARGTVLRAVVDTPTFDTRTAAGMPYVLASVVFDEEAGRVAVFALNRHLDEETDLTLTLGGLHAGLRAESAWELHHADMKAINSREAPDNVAPTALAGVRVEGGEVRARLKPGSWNVMVFRTG